MMHGTLAGTGKFVILPVDQGFEHGPARSFQLDPAGYDPDYHAASAVADVEVFVKALEKAGTTAPDKIRDAIAALDFNSLYGHIRFDKAGQISLPQTVIQVQNGNVVPIYGPNGFIDKPEYPMLAWNQR